MIAQVTVPHWRALNAADCCDKCGMPLAVGDFPFCPHGASTLRVVPDSIPGGIVIENLTREPVRVYSHSERRDLMRAAGCYEKVQHVGAPGSDKSKHTSRWI